MMANKLGRSGSNIPLQIIDDNKTTFRLFSIFGLFPLSYENGKFICHEKIFVIVRLVWFVWHLAGIAVMLFVYDRYKDKDNSTTTGSQNNTSKPDTSTTSTTDELFGASKKGEFHRSLQVAIGIFFFIIVDPVQTIILKRAMTFLPKILKEVQHLENINLGGQSSRKWIVSKGLVYNKSKKEMKNKNGIPNGSTSNICIDDELDSNTTPNLNDEDEVEIEEKTKCYNIIRYIILGASILSFVGAFVIGFYKSVENKSDFLPHDIKDEWKFFGCIFYLIFPSLTTWFCVFFIGYQRKMYKVINELPDEIFTNEEYIKNLGDYFQTMQNISSMLVDRIYRFTFGINFALFVLIGTMSTFEMIQGMGEMKEEKNDGQVEFGDIIYLFPIAVCVYMLYVSCETSTSLIHGQHDKLKFKLKGILTSLLVDEMEISKANEKKFKRVEVLYKNIRGFSPQAEVYGGWHVNYKMFVGMVFFMFSYARVFYKYHQGERNELNLT